jgi:hypothetical protein
LIVKYAFSMMNDSSIEVFYGALKWPDLFPGG